MSQERQVIVPFTPYEWKYVRQLFRSRRQEDVEECVIMLSTWISRTGNSTPVAISCSHVLLQAISAELANEGMQDSEKYRAIDDLRSKHGFAIVRFVNYVNEMGQVNTLLRSMVAAVAEFGIPKWVVDIRHAITHQDCPDIYDLRRATTFCLEWLWQNFWLSDSSHAMNSGKAGTKSNDANSQEFGPQQGREQQYVAALRDFNTWRMKNRNIVPSADAAPIPALISIKQHLLLDASGFLACFIRDGHLIQTPAQLKNQKIVTYSDETWQIPESLQHFWEPLFNLFFDLKLGPDLVVAFLWRLKETKIVPESVHQITAYVRTIITQFADVDAFSDDIWSKILDHLLTVAVNFNPKMIDLVMSKCTKMTRKRRKHVHKILGINSGETAPASPSVSEESLPRTPGGHTVHTVEDLQKLLRRDRKKLMEEAVAGEGGDGKEKFVELCDPDEWAEVPFGMTPGQRSETFTIAIEKINHPKPTRISGIGEKRKIFDLAITLDE